MNSKPAGPEQDTRQKILDASEILFARHGYRGTSLRSITGAADVNVAAVNYHFGSKKALLESMIKRRIQPLNDQRRKRLEDVRSAAHKRGRKSDTRDVLLAFIEPTLLFRESAPGAKEFITFIARSFADPDDTVQEVFHRAMQSMFQLLLETVSEALPDLPRDVLFWRIHFTLGALFHTMHLCGNPKSSPFRLPNDIDAKTLVHLMIPYVTAGMEAGAKG